MLANKDGTTQAEAAAQAGMSTNTARKYLKSGVLPSQAQVKHTWRTRHDPFEDVWDDLEEKLKDNHHFEAKTLFNDLQKQHPGMFQDGQLRTLQRKIKHWRATEGPAQEVFFSQKHYPGQLSESDFVRMKDMYITINSIPFDHMLYHFILTYSNWEDLSICYSESFESLSEGLQNALWKLGQVPERHRSDNLSAAVRELNNKKEFTDRYNGLVSHYGLEAERINPNCPHENGDIEQRHYRTGNALDQALMLRGSRDFKDIAEYEQFLNKLLQQLNAGRSKRLAEEQEHMHSLPLSRLNDYKRIIVRVRKSSTIHVQKNTYSVHSRLRGEQVEVRLTSTELEIWYGQKHIYTHPRLRGKSKASINYRHIIDSLVRKPGAFANYIHQECLFPSTCFRVAYDALTQTGSKQGIKDYLKILYMAAHQNQPYTEEILWWLIQNEEAISAERVQELLDKATAIIPAHMIEIEPVDLSLYDNLLCAGDVS